MSASGGKPCLLIDLDDTLFEERDYVLSGFRTVAEHLVTRHGGNADHIFDRMLWHLANEGRGRIFDDILSDFHISRNDEPVDKLVALYRSHHPKIECYQGVKMSLQALARDYSLCLVTDGLPDMQRHKVEALGLEDYFEIVIYCWALEMPKPDPGGYLMALESLGRANSPAIVVGDNPMHDGLAAAQLGLPFVRVLTPRCRDIPLPSEVDQVLVVEGFNALPDILDQVVARPADFNALEPDL